MTITATDSRWPYVGDGVTTSFPYTGRIFAATDLEVYADEELQGTGYTVAGVGDTAGGTVDFAVAPAAATAVLLVRAVPATQEIDYRENDPFPAETHERGLDKLTVLIQQLRDGFTRTVRLASSAPAAVLELPGAIAGRALKWSDDGGAIVNSDGDPDAAVVLAAAADAAATTALDRADEALAATVAIGLSNFETLDTVLTDGDQDYLLPVAVPAAKNLLVYIGGQPQTPETDYTVTGLLETDKTLHLAQAVSDDPTGLEWPSDLQLFVLVLASGLTTNALNSKSVTEPKLGDGAVSTRATADGAITEPKLGLNAVALANVKAEGEVGALLVRGPGNALGHLPVGAHNTILLQKGTGMLPIAVPLRRETPLLELEVTYAQENIDIEAGPWTAYDHLRIDIAGLQPVAPSNGLLARVKVGGSWKAGSSDYASGRFERRFGDTDYEVNDFSHNQMELAGKTKWSNLDRAALFGSITVRKENDEFLMYGELIYGGVWSSGWGKCRVTFGGWLRDLDGQATEGLRFFPNGSGGFMPLGRTGTVSVYAIEE